MTLGRAISNFMAAEKVFKKSRILLYSCHSEPRSGEESRTFKESPAKRGDSLRPGSGQASLPAVAQNDTKNSFQTLSEKSEMEQVSATLQEVQ